MDRPDAPTLCMIHEGIGNDNAISKVAASGVRLALEAGWKVTVVAKRLDEDLRGDVEWLKLYVPPRLYLLKWVTARRFIKAALGGRTFDVVHAHQPQAASVSDVFQCHYLTRIAYQRKCLERGTSLRARAVRLQEQGILYAEDFYYKRWNPRTRMLFDSGLTRDDFTTLYGRPPRADVLLYEFPTVCIATDDERRAARQAVLGRDPGKIVVGYLGGINERKGYRRLLAAAGRETDLFLLLGGTHTESFEAPQLGGRYKGYGLTSETDQFYAACDVLLVPSLYEPLGLVAFEAAARGTPVIATEEVGALPHLLEYGLGARWTPGEPLAPLARRLMADRAAIHDGVRRMSAAHGQARYGQRLLSVYDDIYREKHGHSPNAAARATPPAGAVPEPAAAAVG